MITIEDVLAAIKFTTDEDEDSARRPSSYDGAYHCFKYHGDTIDGALKLALRVLTLQAQGAKMVMPVARDETWYSLEVHGQKYMDGWNDYANTMRGAPDLLAEGVG